MSDHIKVSVICFAYNHSQYIRNALDSVLTQKTDFPIEIIVHDDASTDGTSSIIREYAKEFINIIPIIEENNVFQRGEWLTRVCAPYIRGEYSIILECDDYWTDHYKLQKQVDFLENHSDYSACAHQTISINMINGETTLFSPFQKDKECGIDDALRSAAFHTSSFLYRTEVILEYEKVLRGLYNIISGDLGLRVMAALHGKIHYSHEIMSIYRLYSNVDSFTMRKHVTRDTTFGDRIGVCVFEIMRRIDDYSGGRYHKKLILRAARVIFSQNGFTYEKGDLKKEYVRLYFLYKLPIKSKLYVIMVEYFPSIYDKLKKHGLLAKNQDEAK